MGIKSFYASVISPFLRKTVLGERIDMALVAFQANMQFAGFMYANSGSKIFSDKEIENIFSALDSRSVEIAKRFMNRQFKSPPNSLMVHPKYFYTENEKAEYRRILKDYNKTVRRFRLPKHLVGPESIYYHHGLRLAPEFVKRNIAGKLFGDVGGWLGDSALIFNGYSPEKIIICEPSADCREKMKKVLRKNGVPTEKYDLQPFGLSDKQEIYAGFECRTLDDLRQNYHTPFGILKADIEGMGLKFLQGAKNTIMNDRPLLSLAIYHNEDEFIGIYRELQNWNLNYHIELQSLHPAAAHGEVILFAYPAEWA